MLSLDGRHLLVTLVVFVTTVGLLWLRKIDGTAYQNVVQWTVTVYIGGAIGKHWIDCRHDDDGPPEEHEDRK